MISFKTVLNNQRNTCISFFPLPVHSTKIPLIIHSSRASNLKIDIPLSLVEGDKRNPSSVSDRGIVGLWMPVAKFGGLLPIDRITRRSIRTVHLAILYTISRNSGNRRGRSRCRTTAYSELDSILGDRLSRHPGTIRLDAINGREGYDSTLGGLGLDTSLTGGMKLASLRTVEVCAVAGCISGAGGHTLLFGTGVDNLASRRANGRFASDAEVLATLADNLSVVLRAELRGRSDGRSDRFRIGFVVAVSSTASASASSASSSAAHGLGTVETGGHDGGCAVVVGVVAGLGAFVVVDAVAGNESGAGVHAVLQGGLLVFVEVLGTVAGSARLFKDLSSESQQKRKLKLAST